MKTKRELVHQFMALYHCGISIGNAKKLLLKTKAYTSAEVDRAAKTASEELLKTHQKKRLPVKDVDIEQILSSRKKTSSTRQIESTNVFWLLATAFIVIIIALVFLFTYKQSLKLG